MRRYCEDCGKPTTVFRRIRKRGKHHGRIKITADKHHTLCFACSKKIHDRVKQEQKFEQ